MRSARADWWNDEFPEKEQAFQALLAKAKELRRLPTPEEVAADERTAQYVGIYARCWGNVRRACKVVGAYLRTHPEEAAGMDESLWQEGEYRITSIPLAQPKSSAKKTRRAVATGRAEPSEGANDVAVLDKADGGADATDKTAVPDERKNEQKEAVQKRAEEQVAQPVAKIEHKRDVERHALLVRVRNFYWRNGRFPGPSDFRASNGSPEQWEVWTILGTWIDWPKIMKEEFGLNRREQRGDSSDETESAQKPEDRSDAIQKDVTEQAPEQAARTAQAAETQEPRGQGRRQRRAVPRYATLREALMPYRKFYWKHGRFPSQSEANKDPEMPTYTTVWKRVGPVTEWPEAMEREFGPNWREPDETEPDEQ